MSTAKLRKKATSLFSVALAAADPALSVRKILNTKPLPVLQDGKIILIAVGKAATLMAEEALCHIPQNMPYKAIVITNYENARKIDGCEIVASGHPVPDENGEKAAQKVIKILKQADKKDFILTLISGGGSALIPAPIEGITLQDKIDTNELLLRNGYDIHDINMVRQQLSKLKGGGFQRLAKKSKIRSLIISDVVGDNLKVIASGPTTAAIGSKAEVVNLFKSRGHWSQLPDSVRAVLKKPELDPISYKHAGTENTLICSNRQSLLKLLKAMDGYDAQVLDFNLDGDVEQAAEKIAKGIMQTELNKQRALVWGGETTVTIKGNGKGGRNQELALRVAEKLEKLPKNWVFMSAGTDGRDGPTDAAGGLVDDGTVNRLYKKGRSVRSFLDQSDSYNALMLSNDLFVTGPTGTNVADIQLFLCNPIF